jgi:DNA-binding MarR family transcriptional regulator
MTDKTPVGVAQRKLDLESSVGVLLNFLSNRLTASGSAVYRARFDLGINEFRVLAMLAYEPGISGARVSEVMGLDVGAVSRALQSLEARRLVSCETDPRHSAYKIWSLSPEGAKLQDEAVVVSMERDAILMDGVSDRERELLVRLLRGMLTRVDRLRALNK